ncbi:hypothetical protein K7432_004276 [Basidiobolus ranarum]|uniref:CHHC U11-48K-type domain-containing protein n=1 Tax=Basidiobolus ranarum TaxID=34480 RepID=A0ABR2W5A7_9FUNG
MSEVEARKEYISNLHKDIDIFEQEIVGLLKLLGTSSNDLEENILKINELLQCPFDPSHKVPKETYSSHFRKCELKSLGITNDDNKPLPSSLGFYTKAPAVISMLQTPVDTDSREQSFKPEIKKPLLSRHWDKIDLEDLEIESVKDPNSEPLLTNNDTFPEHLLRSDNIETKLNKLRKWTQIPRLYEKLDIKELNPMKTRGWLVNNLPQGLELHNSTSQNFSSEMELADFIYHRFLVPSVNIEEIKKHLDLYLGQVSRKFTLNLWKHLMSELIVLMILPLADASIQLKVDESSNHSQLPAQVFSVEPVLDSTGDNLVYNLLDHQPHSQPSTALSVAQRRKEYEYLIQASKYIRELHGRDDQNIYEGFEEALERAKLIKEQNQKRKSKADLLAEQRDYKRRRKSYRAKNVRITQRTPNQIHRDLIAAYMEDFELLNDP